jgi:roadblock/LC7 domain-containing protein
LKMQEYAYSGPKLDAYKSQMAKIMGEQAAEMIAVLATFEVTEVRPLIDFRQGWEKSI